MSKGFLLVQLGSPRSAEVPDVQKFLVQFLGDPLVVQPRPLLWNLLLRYFIAPRRAPKSALLYKEMLADAPDGIMPLVAKTGHFVEGVRNHLADAYPLEHCFQYGSEPTPLHALRKLAERGCDEILVVPLYPHRAGATVEAACQAIKHVQHHHADLRHLHLSYHRGGFATSTFWVEAQADQIAAKLADMAIPPTDVVFSLHGYPEARIAQGDPYQEDCEASVAHIVRELRSRKALTADCRTHISYQSRFGRQKWIDPQSSDVLGELGRQQSSVLVVCPAFTCENLETLVEVDRELRDLFYTEGGRGWERVGCLDASPAWCAAFAQFLRQLAN